MVDVRFERLTKLGGYEWRETVSIEHLFFSMDDLSAERARYLTCSRLNGVLPSSQS
jgi:hypothetical protein